jgi:hypothetical protein
VSRLLVLDASWILGHKPLGNNKMKIQVVQALVCNALGALSLWATTANAQQQKQPRIALKLTEAAHQQQQNDSNFIATLIQRAQPEGARLSAPQVSVDKILKSQRLDDLTARVVPTARFNTFNVPNFDAWYNILVGSASEHQARSVDETETQNSTGTDEPRLALPKDTLDLIHRLHELAEVESVHALYPGPPPAINAADDPRSVNQGYLNAAPQGINARYAWGFSGGDGASVNIIDVEQGWNLNHEDLVGQVTQFTLILAA